MPGVERVDPLASFRFHVELKGIIEGGFTECSGLKMQREVYKYKEGGVNNYIHQLPVRTKFSNVKLKSGVASDDLWDWCMKGLYDNKVEYANVSIIVMDATGNVARRWNLVRAYPVKWSAPNLKSDSKKVAIQTLELAFHGLTAE